jgi:hypothetical protein
VSINVFSMSLNWTFYFTLSENVEYLRSLFGISLDAVTGYLYIIVSGLLAEFLFSSYVEDVSFSSKY